MPEQSLNPYRPTVSTELREEHEMAEVRFRLTQHLLHYGESKYLLHCLSTRLFLGSMVMISLSTGLFILAMYYGQFSFVTSIVIALGTSAAVYEAMIHNTKVTIRENLKRYGMRDGAVCSLSLIDHNIELSTPSGTYKWHTQNVKIYNTHKGHLLCPEKLVFLIIPKANDSTRTAYKLLIKNLKSRRLEHSDAA